MFWKGSRWNKFQNVWFSTLELGSRFHPLGKSHVFLLSLIWLTLFAHQYMCLWHAELSLQDITINQRQTHPQFPFHLWTLYGVGVTVMLEEASVLDFFFLRNIWYNGNNNASYQPENVSFHTASILNLKILLSFPILFSTSLNTNISSTLTILNN